MFQKKLSFYEFFHYWMVIFPKDYQMKIILSPNDHHFDPDIEY